MNSLLEKRNATSKIHTITPNRPFLKCYSRDSFKKISFKISEVNIEFTFIGEDMIKYEIKFDYLPYDEDEIVSYYFSSSSGKWSNFIVFFNDLKINDINELFVGSDFIFSIERFSDSSSLSSLSSSLLSFKVNVAAGNKSGNIIKSDSTHDIFSSLDQIKYVMNGRCTPESSGIRTYSIF
ncbi:MAG: hypothetical protein N2749_05060 [Clostridia bacterium]|nr:hypothetical protein [Clostridia bacterium]